MASTRQPPPPGHGAVVMLSLPKGKKIADMTDDEIDAWLAPAFDLLATQHTGPQNSQAHQATDRPASFKLPD